jgi:phospholipid-binding lipoprotein MlaA
MQDRLSLRRRLLSLVLALALGASLGACATRPDPSDKEATAEFWENNDPLEPLNRGIFFVNQAFDTMFLGPIAEFYRYLVPWPIRQVLRNGLANLREPVTLANDLLQGNVGRAADTTARFLLNSTLGLGGAFDVATDFGHPRQFTGFGDTLAVWGIDSGPYLMLPFLGPSSFRDGIGLGVDLASDPWPWIVRGNDAGYFAWPRRALGIIDLRENLNDTINEVNRTSLDPYATFRSAFWQLRRRETEGRATPFSARPVTRIENR